MNSRLSLNESLLQVWAIKAQFGQFISLLLRVRERENERKKREERERSFFPLHLTLASGRMMESNLGVDAESTTTIERERQVDGNSFYPFTLLPFLLLQNPLE